MANYNALIVLSIKKAKETETFSWLFGVLV